MNMLALNPTQ